MSRTLYGGYGLTEMRRYATEYKIPGRSKMDGDQLLAALHAYWDARRKCQEQAVLDTVKVEPGTLLRHKSTGTIVRVISDIETWAKYGALHFDAKYIEVGEHDGGMVGNWKNHGVELAEYRNRQDAERRARGDTPKHMLWQYEATTPTETRS